MRAVTIPQFGGPEVLRIADLPEPMPGPGELCVHVTATTVNPTDVLLRSGMQRTRVKDLSPPFVPGMELAGVVDAVGSGVSMEVGSPVIGAVSAWRPQGGAQAERVIVPASSVVDAPRGASHTEATTLPMNGLTAYFALKALALTQGQTLAVLGAAGAVGGFAIELAKVYGLRVIADAKVDDESIVSKLGADVIVPRDADTPSHIKHAALGGVDGLIDAALVGGRALRAVRDAGRVVTLRPSQGAAERGISLTNVFVPDHLHDQFALDELRQLAEDGSLSLRVATTLSLGEAARAHKMLEAGGVRGRPVLVW